jgi:hypothetical protein
MVRDLPYIYEVETTNACPYRCIMCPRGRGSMTRPVGFMKPEDFETLVGQVPEEQKILRLHHFGEPVLHPDIADFIMLARQRGLMPALSVNPSSLTEQLIERLVESGVGILCFSLDSLKSERLLTIRGISRSAEYCLEMIDYFVARSRRGARPVFKILQMVALTINSDEREDFLSLKERYPGDDVYVYLSANYGFGDAALVRETCEEASPGLCAGASFCNAPFEDAVVLWNGDVVLCCYDFDGINRVGTIRRETVRDIWHGEPIGRIRRVFERKDTAQLALCRDCFLAPHRNLPDGFPLGRGYNEEEQILRLFPAFSDVR